MTQHDSHTSARLLIYIAILATIGLYWTGLRGPFILDDLPNLSPLQAWQDGQATAIELIFGNRSGILGRPVSMATLWFSAATGGLHPFPFKLGNLLIHIACGLLGWQLLRRLLEHDPRLAYKANLIAAVLAGLWMLHPINVSTVLYAVQRMAQLSTLFTLAAVWVYVLARNKLIEDNYNNAQLKLFVAFPLLLVAGLLSKENAAVAPMLCLVVELAYFYGNSAHRRTLHLFYGLFLILPAVIVAAVLLLSPDILLGGYAIRDFTLIERLLSQSRALMEYVGLTLLPRGGQLGVYVDDFTVSRGLLNPPSTFFSLAALLAISGSAIALRYKVPSFFAGWFFFLVAHSVESSLLPLELYFEHRNYLPSFGILLATLGLFEWSAAKVFTRSSIRTARIDWILITVVAIAFSTITWQQVQVWRSEESLASHALRYRPNSLRAALAQATVAVNAGRWEEALVLTGKVASSDNPRHRLLGNVHTITIDCLRGAGGDKENLHRAELSEIKFLTIADAQAFTQLAVALQMDRCGPAITNDSVADSIVRILDKTPTQKDIAQPKWQLRTTAADLYMRSGRWSDALRQAELAWQPTISDLAIGGMLTRMYIENGDSNSARRTLDQVRSRVSKHEKLANQELENLQNLVDTMENKKSTHQ